MPKNKYKRPRPSPQPDLPQRQKQEHERWIRNNLSSSGSNSIESCLKELEALSGYTNDVVVPSASTSVLDHDPPLKPQPSRKSKKQKVERKLEQATTVVTTDSKSATLSDGNNALQKKTAFPVLWNPSIPTPIDSFPLNRHKRTLLLNRIRQWNTSMNLWMKPPHGGKSASKSTTYPSGLLPSLEMEVARHFQVEQLSSFLLTNCPGLKMPSFERWLIDAKLDEKIRKPAMALLDPVLSPSISPHSPACRRLFDEIISSSQTNNKNNIKKIIQQLCLKTQTAVSELIAQSKPLLNKTPFRNNERIELEKKHNGIPKKHQEQQGKILQDQHQYYYYCTLIFHCKRWKTPFRIKITSCHYDKLLDMFLRVHNQPGIKPSLRLFESGSSTTTSSSNNNNTNGRATKALHCFHYLVMTTILRYSSLSGGQLLRDLRGGGMQGAVHGELFQALQQELLLLPLSSGSSNSGNRTMLECFASPLNSYLSSYCSAFFDDLDWHFGSVGDFWSVVSEVDLDNDEDNNNNNNNNSCCCQANPPFSPAFMHAMVDRLEAVLAQADQNNRSLSFVVIVPTVHDNDDEDQTKHNAKDKNNNKKTVVVPVATRLAAPSFRKMVSSSHCRCHVILKAKEHGYVEGAQHLRPTRYKESLFDTSVILLQSQRALKEEEPLNLQRWEDRIRQAFASRHLDELAQRQEETEAKSSSS